MKRLYVYEVYLKSSRGTIKRLVHIDRRSVKKAAQVAKLAVERVLRETTSVADVVPCRETVKKVEDNGRRGRRAMTTTTVTLKRSRRPKARESLRITPKGKVVPIRFEKELVTDGRAKVPSERPTAQQLARVCESKTCIRRGYCTHLKRKPGQDFREWVVKTNHFRDVKIGPTVVGRERLFLFVIAEDAPNARKLARQSLHDQGIKGVRFLSVDFSIQPGRKSPRR